MKEEEDDFERCLDEFVLVASANNFLKERKVGRATSEQIFVEFFGESPIALAALIHVVHESRSSKLESSLALPCALATD